MKSAPSDNNSFVPAHSNCIHALYFPCQCFCARTPTKGVTLPSWAYSVTSVFQSTLPRREWLTEQLFFRSCSSDFNPHSHEGSDLFLITVFTVIFIISIHTPTKGVTFPRQFNLVTFYFNPHSHEGSDRFLFFTCFIASYFNPHSHEGSDTFPTTSGWQLLISIHTPTKGVTASVGYNIVTGVWFQSTLPRREWRRQIWHHG